MAIKLTKKYLIILSISFLLCLIIILFNQKNIEYITSSTNNIKILANGVEVDTFPTKSEGYVYDGLECINGTIGIWNEDTWSLKIDTNKADGCIIYFITRYKEELLKGSDPVLTQGLVPVEIDTDGTVKKANIQTSWYSYKDSEWANAVIVNDESIRNVPSGTVISMDNIVQMYVWIPRYEYKKSSIVDASQDIEINFVGLDKTSTSQQVENDDIIVHPAFCWGNYCQDDRENPENMELPGIWVGKFEQGTDNTIKPNQNSMNNLNVSTLYDKVNDMNSTNGLNTTSDIHMIKNMDWGAIAYLSQSMYGICNDDGTCTDSEGNNIKVENNNYYTSNNNIITGCGGNDTSVAVNCPDTNRWQTSNGIKASTTHNISGIYDMAGGRLEYVMGSMNTQDELFYSSSSGFLVGPDKKYYDEYGYGTSENDLTRNNIGDGIFISSSTSWNNDRELFVANNYSWFTRGDYALGNYVSGIWGFHRHTGAGYNTATSRTILTPLTTYTITIEQSPNGSIEEINSAVADNTVELNVSPNEGYLLKGFEIVNSSTKDIYKTYTNYEKEFIMPKFNVIIRPIYIEGYEFSYTGTSQEFIVPTTGNYKVELWGASGGGSINTVALGAYTKGIINLEKNKELYVLIGESGEKGLDGVNATQTVGKGGKATFNGGGAGGNAGGDNEDPVRYQGYVGGNSGGGATDIRLISGNWNDIQSLNSRLIVSGAGGGSINTAESYDTEIGSAGGLISQKGAFVKATTTEILNYLSRRGYFANQISGNSFGIGGVGSPSGSSYACPGHSGGGGGYYGGYGGGETFWYCIITGGAGGSSFISGHTGAVAITSKTDRTPKTGCTTGTTDNSCSIHYSGMIFTDTVMIDGAGYAWTNVKGELEQMPNPSGGFYELGKGHTGNGYARIIKMD